MFSKKISIVAFIVTCLCTNISVFAGETETYKVVVPFIYDDAGRFMDGYAWVRLDGKMGLIDKNGKVVVPLEYHYISWSFFDGYTQIVKIDESGRKNGFVDREGKIIAPPIYDDVGDFHEGLITTTTPSLTRMISLQWKILGAAGRLCIPNCCVLTKMVAMFPF